jgi:hypothetical protein
MEHSTIQKTSPKDVFLHLLSIVTLYTSATEFLVLLFQYINLAFPDVLEIGYRDSAMGLIRWAIATLIVVFPVYLLTSRHLLKVYEKEPAKRNLRIRKWLIYFTLFTAALIVIGDLVTLINSFLQGDLTLRFVLKVFSVFFVAGSVFTYYFWDIKKHQTE